jgi:hypothetical protein
MLFFRQALVQRGRDEVKRDGAYLSFASIAFLCFAGDMKLRTKLSVAECRTRLGSATDLGGMALSWDSAAPSAVMGEFRGPVFRLHTKKYYSNSFTPFFYGKLTEADGGAVLEGDFRLHPFIRLFMLFWFSFLILFGASAIIVPPMPSPTGGVNRHFFYMGLALLTILGLGFVQFGRWLARGEREVIHSFLKSTLEANDQ